MIRRGELWRLVTSAFPHSDILHLAFNLYWLWVFGSLIEQVYGHLKTAMLLILFALGSGALEFAFGVGGVGLSGVGYGMFGMLWVLSKRDERFRDAVDGKTIQLFVIWFFFCVATTILHIFAVANIAHAAGAILGALTGFAIVSPHRRHLAVAAISIAVLFGIWGSTLGRPRINVSGKGGYEEGKWGYDALVAGDYRDAAKWLNDAATYQPNIAAYWFDLGIADEKLGKKVAAHAAYQRAHEIEPANPRFEKAMQNAQ